MKALRESKVLWCAGSLLSVHLEQTPLHSLLLHESSNCSVHKAVTCNRWRWILQARRCPKDKSPWKCNFQTWSREEVCILFMGESWLPRGNTRSLETGVWWRCNVSLPGGDRTGR